MLFQSFLIIILNSLIILTKFYLFNYDYIMRVTVFLSFKNIETWIDSGTIERELKLFEEPQLNKSIHFFHIWNK